MRDPHRQWHQSQRVAAFRHRLHAWNWYRLHITLAARLLGLDVGPRITGHAYFEAVLDALQRRGGGRVFFFGSSPQVLARIRASFGREYPALGLEWLYRLCKEPRRMWRRTFVSGPRFLGKVLTHHVFRIA